MEPLLQLFCDLLEETRGIDRQLSRNVVLSMLGLNTRSQIEEALRLSGLPQDGLDELNEAYAVRSSVVAPAAFAEAIEVLASLKAQGYAIYISSGGRPAPVQKRAAIAGVTRFARLVLGSDEVAAKGPGHFRLIAGDLGIPAGELPARTWLIGDGTYDMQVARAAGMHAVGRLTGDNGAAMLEAGANMLIHDLDQLQPLLAATSRDDE